MSKFITKYYLVFYMLLPLSSGYSQATADLIRMGDVAYEIGNYASAIQYYQKVTSNEYKTSRSSTYPYEFMGYSGKVKKKLKKSKNENGSENENQPQDLVAPEEAGVNKDEQYATHQIAECYRLMNDYRNGEAWYVKSLQLSWGITEEYVMDRFWYAVILMSNSKYQDAIDELENYLQSRKDTSSGHTDYINKLIKDCKYAKLPNSKTAGYNIAKEDSIINKGSANYALTYYDDNHIILSSARSEGIPDEENKIDAQYLSDIYLLRKTGPTWDDVSLINQPVNTTQHEGATAVNADKGWMFFTRWPAERKGESKIYLSKWFVNKWMKPLELPGNINVKGFNTKHPALTEDNKYLLFSSDMPGGKGGFDIWYCELDRQGNTGEPINAGNEVNTPYDEVTPFYHYHTKTLYFSSNGHTGVGGFDIFKTDFLFNQNQKLVKNLGFPMNSARNDMYFIMSADQTAGFLTSNRSDCPDCDGPNCNEVFSFAKLSNEFYLSGFVYDAENDSLLPNCRITIKDVKGEFEPFYLETDSTGEYRLPLASEMHIFIKAQKMEYFADANVVSTIGLSETQNFTQDFFLNIIPYAEIPIHGIEYDYGKATLRPDSKVFLDSLVDFLNLNDNIVIEISSHTDSQSSNDFNMKLSQNRAETVVRFLIDNGISSERLLAKGYGETIPLVKNAQTEEEHQRNRRTSFRTLSEDYEPITKYRPKK